MREEPHCVARDLLQELSVGSSTDLQDFGELVNVVVAREQNLPCQQFRHNAPHRPDVNCVVCVYVCVGGHACVYVCVQLQNGTAITKRALNTQTLFVIVHPIEHDLRSPPVARGNIACHLIICRTC